MGDPDVSEDRPVGKVLDGLGVTATMGEGDLVEGAVVLLKVIDGHGQVRMTSCWSDGMAWVERVGMLRIAEQMDLPTDRARGAGD